MNVTRRQLLTVGVGTFLVGLLNGHALAISQLRYKPSPFKSGKSPATDLVRKVQYAGMRPSEVYFDAKSNLHPMWLGLRDHRLAIPGTRPNGFGAQIIELRGWLRQKCGDCDDLHPNRDEHPEPNDFRYELEIDPEWTDQQGINLHDLMRVGTILMHDAGNHFAAVTRPLIHIEIMAWRPGQSLGKIIDLGDYMRSNIPNPGWTFRDDDKPNSDSWRAESDPNLVPHPDTVWPWNPLKPSNDTTRFLKHVPPHDETDINKGDYVLVEGALITDDPHWPADGSGAEGSRAWGDHKLRFGLNPKEHKNNPSRWTEIHPPDRVEILPYKPPRESVRCVAVIARPAIPPEETTLDLKIPSPGPRPDPEAVLDCREKLGPETLRETITTGPLITKTMNADGTGTVHVFVTVKGQAATLISPPVWGQFKAIYRVFWRLGPLQMRVSLQVQNMPVGQPIPVAQPIVFTVQVEDWHHRTPLSGQVKLDGQNLGATGFPLNYTFHENTRGAVTVPGYPETPLSFGVARRKLKVWTNPPSLAIGNEDTIPVTVFAEDEISSTAVPNAKVFIDDREVANVGTTFSFNRKPRCQIGPPCPPPPGCSPRNPLCPEPIDIDCEREFDCHAKRITVKAFDYEEAFAGRGRGTD